MKFSVICKNVFGIAENILVICYDQNGADHDAAVHKGATVMQKSQFKIKQRKVPF